MKNQPTINKKDDQNRAKDWRGNWCWTKSKFRVVVLCVCVEMIKKLYEIML